MEEASKQIYKQPAILTEKQNAVSPIAERAPDDHVSDCEY